MVLQVHVNYSLSVAVFSRLVICYLVAVNCADWFRFVVTESARSIITRSQEEMWNNVIDENDSSILDAYVAERSKNPDNKGPRIDVD